MNHDLLLPIKAKVYYKTFSLPKLYNFESTGWRHFYVFSCHSWIRKIRLHYPFEEHAVLGTGAIRNDRINERTWANHSLFEDRLPLVRLQTNDWKKEDTTWYVIWWPTALYTNWSDGDFNVFVDSISCRRFIPRIHRGRIKHHVIKYMKKWMYDSTKH
jgi:hypothetical protein